ncbi:M14 family zinc carboxypeptidase [Aquisalibacillus elongatus]|uniref:Zinc carboxypeptidase n=1 Tax=Aquisalibacillus elongatus TaxID=485577 RepID=A0A3N5BA10_9BACI|nr:M14 family zinc carboxypeptidase [Aquisalibacillus elongatus]RPF54217.1 zinc carboxypeptidase [Aquisalibacillus elongatus]
MYKKLGVLFSVVLCVVMLTSVEHTYSESESLEGVALEDQTYVYQNKSKDSKQLKGYNSGSILKFKNQEGNWYTAVVILNNERVSGYIHKEDVDVITTEQKDLTGYSVNHTKVYQSPTKNDDHWKSYAKGEKLYYKTFSEQWYEATVYVNGEPKTGYIHVGDVDEPTQEPTSLSGVGVKKPTTVYDSPNSNSDALKTYPSGSFLKFETFIEGWYKATVYLNHKPHTGYIKASDVDFPTDQPENLSGVGVKSPTKVYALPNASSDVLKSYQSGSILKYQTFIDGWYKATVYLNHEPHTGYIKASDVEEPVDQVEDLTGFVVKNQAHVYSKLNRSSDTLKSYGQGEKLYFQTFTQNWYKATVYLNHKAHTGYIHKSDVEIPVEDQKNLKGYGYDGTTHVYSKPSKQSSPLKSYREGSLLYYRSFMDQWYEATVYLDGQAHTGYIHRHDVIDHQAEQEDLSGYAINESTYVYKGTSRNSKKLKGYSYGSKLKFKSFTKNWYEATVYLNHEPHTGYIHKNDVTLGEINPKSVVNPKTKYSYQQMIKDINELESMYPGLVSSSVIGQSYDGRDLYTVKVGNGSTKVHINASTHAREWMTTNLVMDQIDTYSQAYVRNSKVDGYNVRDLLNKVSIYYVPMVNPDGVMLVQEGAGAVSNSSEVIDINGGSKDFSAWKANARGVDLNRNYTSLWDNVKNDPGEPSPTNFKGYEPMSEPEVQALSQYVDLQNFDTAIAYHSSGEIIYWDTLAEGELKEDSRDIADRLSDKTSYPLSMTEGVSGGHFTDWFLFNEFSPNFTLEISPFVGPQPVPLNNYDRIWGQNDSVGLILAEEALKLD